MGSVPRPEPPAAAGKPLYVSYASIGRAHFCPLSGATNVLHILNARRPLDTTAERGPWPVGSLLVEGLTARNITLEVLYPAVVGSEAGREPNEYDLRDYMTENGTCCTSFSRPAKARERTARGLLALRSTLAWPRCYLTG